MPALATWGLRILTLSILSMSTMLATTLSFTAGDVLNAFNSTANSTIATECAPGSLASRTARCAIYQLELTTVDATVTSVSDNRWVIYSPLNMFWWNDAGSEIHFITSATPSGTQVVYATNYTASTNLPSTAQFLVMYTGPSIPTSLTFRVGFVPLTDSGQQDGFKSSLVGGFSIPVQAVPEPGSVLLFASAVGAAFCGRRFVIR